jgi:hypothetical protein
MFDVNVVSANRVRHYSVTPAAVIGWEVKLEENHAVRWREIYEDWHRVERKLTRMKQEVSDLVEQGWTIQAASR